MLDSKRPSYRLQICFPKIKPKIYPSTIVERSKCSKIVYRTYKQFKIFFWLAMSYTSLLYYYTIVTSNCVFSEFNQNSLLLHTTPILKENCIFPSYNVMYVKNMYFSMSGTKFTRHLRLRIAFHWISGPCHLILHGPSILTTVWEKIASSFIATGLGTLSSKKLD